MKELRFTKEEFENWLKSKTADEYVGRACERNDCPVYKFLIEKYGQRLKYLTVYQTVLTFTTLDGDTKRQNFRYKGWKHKLISKIDATFDVGRFITASEVLEILKSV